MSTHTAGMLSIYTVTDLYNYYTARFTLPGAKVPSYFNFEIYTAAGPVYSLVASDAYFFSVFGDRYLTTPAKRADLQNLYVSYGINVNNSVAVNQQAFLRLMKDLRGGVSLSIEQTQFPGHWLRVELNNNNSLTYISCS
ncbi:hypothetical protein EAH73_11980 [Hymenobacter nivis]|uniref:Uncharacterized protein n=2 Tax=Hymenobacter nivis TaxID=1850093 RepID=A0A502GXA0_9BACT|nr:hypothetical protein EAH73_11980 [Hymenobacter nivis]